MSGMKSLSPTWSAIVGPLDAYAVDMTSGLKASDLDEFFVKRRRWREKILSWPWRSWVGWLAQMAWLAWHLRRVT